ncbi:MAG: hypothetical protein JXR61_09735 [Prolixibacteraceae bacterium]|nr:hypothetical protein [Prolixibacteraceae bacterium]
MEINKFYTCFFNSHLLNSETADELRELTNTYPWFQLAWVIYLKNLKKIDAQEYEKVTKQTAIRVNNQKLLRNYINSNTNSNQLHLNSEDTFSIQHDDISNNTTSESSLIDRFLTAEQNSIRRKLPDSYHSGNDNKNILEKSEIEDDELVTETLANIFLQQKNYEKAIRAFKKLSLKYPEKNIYFATRIKEAEDLKNIN